MKLVTSLLVVVVALVAVVAYSATSSASSVVGSGKVYSRDVTVIPTSQNLATPVKHDGYGDTQIWIDPTAVPTDFAGGVVLEQGAGGSYVAVTPTVLGNTSTITHGNRATPVVIIPDGNIGTHSRLVVNATGATTGTLETRWLLRNTEE